MAYDIGSNQQTNSRKGQQQLRLNNKTRKSENMLKSYLDHLGELPCSSLSFFFFLRSQKSPPSCPFPTLLFSLFSLFFSVFLLFLSSSASQPYPVQSAPREPPTWVPSLPQKPAPDHHVEARENKNKNSQKSPCFRGSTVGFWKTK